MVDAPLPTTLPDAIAALLSAFAAIPADPDYGDIFVSDGPALGAQALNMIAVGVGNPSVSHSLRQQGSRPAYDEAYDITCLTWAWGGAAMQQHRGRCVTVLAAVRSALDFLDLGLNTHVRLGDSLEWTQAVSGEGASCSVQFTVHVVASI